MVLRDVLGDAGAARVIGLTGGIACGKSLVATILRELGAPVVDADILAREVVARGSDGLEALVERFGQAVLTAEGELDRKKLGALVFADDDARAALNSITHPRIAEASRREIGRHATAGAKDIVYEAALIIENKLYTWMYTLIVVTVPEPVQLARLMARDQIAEPAARARIDAQMSLADKVAVANYVVDNHGTPADTRAQVERIWTEITAS